MTPIEIRLNEFVEHAENFARLYSNGLINVNFLHEIHLEHECFDQLREGREIFAEKRKCSEYPYEVYFVYRNFKFFIIVDDDKFKEKYEPLITGEVIERRPGDLASWQRKEVEAS